LREVWNALAGQVTFDDVVGVRKDEFAGHVYNLQTGSGFYEVTAGRIIVHNCRSLRLPVIGEGPISERPARPFTERQLLGEYAEENGLGKVTSRDKLPRGHKGAYDEFARKRKRELTGRVPAATSYDRWLRDQPASFQDDVLGKTKAQLFRKGELTLDRFVHRTGDELTLKELAQREADAFRRAGLNPEDY
jgi:hypothetical protein